MVHKPLAWALVAWVLLLAGCKTLTRDTGPRLALVIGNADYENATPLANPGNDARDMCKALKNLDFDATCLFNLRDREAMDAAVKAYADKLDGRSAGVVYYSGHGVQAGGANFLIPIAAQLQPRSDPTRVLYGVQDMYARLRQKSPRFQLVILDACRAELLNPRAPAAAARNPGTRSALIRTLEAVPGATNGLQAIQDAPPGTIVFFATASRDTAFDGEGRNGPLTKHILEHIETKGITVEDFIKKVTAGVERETARDYKKRQVPFTYGSFAGNFCLARCPHVVLPPLN
jgi:uncharacterized caspase-like protein